MLNDTKRDFTYLARKLTKPYEKYSIDELADAYCAAIDTNNRTLKDIYISALVLRFWYVIDKLYKNNTAPCFHREDFFWIVYEGIEYACKYRGWKDPDKNLNAQQCINKCINTIKLQKYYDIRLDKNKTINYCTSMNTPICGKEGDEAKTLGDVLEADNEFEVREDTADMYCLVQDYIDRNKIVEAILIDNIVFNDVQKHFKKNVKTKDAEGNDYRYTEHSSEFWPYKLVQIVSKLPDTYKNDFLKRYRISEEKLTAVLDVIDRAPNQKLYRYLRGTLAELKLTYVN